MNPAYSLGVMWPVDRAVADKLGLPGQVNCGYILVAAPNRNTAVELLTATGMVSPADAGLLRLAASSTYLAISRDAAFAPGVYVWRSPFVDASPVVQIIDRQPVVIGSIDRRPDGIVFTRTGPAGER